MSVDRHHKFQKGALLFSDGAESQIEIIICKTCNFLLSFLELLIDAGNVLIKLYIGDYFLCFVIYLFKCNVKGEILFTEDSMVALL